jgi:hypothetical protein
MEYEQDHTDDQHDVNETGCYVKCEKPKQPENDQNGGDYPKHVLTSSFLREPVEDRARAMTRLEPAERKYCHVADTLNQICDARCRYD